MKRTLAHVLAFFVAAYVGILGPALAGTSIKSNASGGISVASGAGATNRLMKFDASDNAADACWTDDGTLTTTTACTGLGLGTATPKAVITETMARVVLNVADGAAHGVVAVGGLSGGILDFYDTNATVDKRRARMDLSNTTWRVGRLNDDATATVAYLTGELSTDVVTLGSAAVAGLAYVSGTGNHTFSDGRLTHTYTLAATEATGTFLTYTHGGLNGEVNGLAVSLDASVAQNGVSVGIQGTLNTPAAGGGIGVGGAAINNTAGGILLGVRGTANSQNGGAANSRDFGVFGVAEGANVPDYGIGVSGAVNAATHVNAYGGLFWLSNSAVNTYPIDPAGRAALVADNRDTTGDIFRARDNGVDVFKIVDGTRASAAGATLDVFDLLAATATITGAVDITTATGFNLASIKAPTYSAASALTITNAATLYIGGAPVGGGVGPATITNAYALWVDDGVARFDGAIRIGNTVNAVSPTAPNRTITLNVAGTDYFVHAKTTND